MIQEKCPRCNKEIDLDKPQSIIQKWQNKKTKQFAERMSGTKLPEIKNYYCNCGTHITLIKRKGKWRPITAS